MDRECEAGRITLERREIAAFAHARGITVECLTGSLWITAEGLAGDHILAAGERLALRGRTRVFVSALTPAELALTPCGNESPLRRLSRACAAALVDRIRRWRQTPLAAYPTTQLR